jgi:large subunit ribosomal protein L24
MGSSKRSASRRPHARIKVGDTVFVRCGRDRESRLSAEEAERLDPEAQKKEANRRAGRRGRVLRVLPDRRHLVVEGVNIMVKHSRPRGRTTQAAQLQAGRTQQPGKIAIANVMLVCPRCERPTRVRRGELERKPVRICRRCGEPVDAIK